MELTNNSLSKSEKDLELAIKSNDLTLLQEVIQRGVNINARSYVGSTALHMAVSGNASVDILRTLMENGATVAVKNNFGLSPVKSLHRTSLQTVTNLLKLEKCFDFRDRDNNSLMHIFMTEQMMFNNEEFWMMIATEYQHLNIDFNSQNKSGTTALMLAAENPADENLIYILNIVDNLDLFVSDCKGDTFLHVYMASVKLQEDLEFFTTLLQGNTKNCPKPLVKKLLLSQNLDKNTPFHIFMENTKNSIQVCLLQLFTDAGADVNICNTFGKTVLHCAIRNFTSDECRIQDEEEQNIKYLVRCGANVNEQDCNGDSPIFLTYGIKSVCILIESGANVNIQDKFGRTPLIANGSFPCDNFEVLDKLLAAGADVNMKDYHGSSVLHHVACNYFDLQKAIVPYFLHHGCEITHDSLGHLPCHKAYECGNKEMFEALCKCDKVVHGNNINFKFQEKRVKRTNLEDINQFVNDFQCYQESGISKLLETPGIGPVVFEQEAEMIRTAVNNLVSNLCHEISIRDELFSLSLVHSGSSRENTKVGLPDEFDFVCVLEKLSEKCEIDLENTKDESGFAVLKLKSEFNCHECQCLFTENGHLATHDVWKRFNSLMKDVFRNPEIFSQNIRYYDITFINQVESPTCQILLYWFGCFYKNLGISIDLALACCVKGYWPRNANIDKLSCDVQQLREEGALLLIQTELQLRLLPPQKVRMSALKAEIKHMDSLPNIAKDAYRICKICCDNRICPDLVDEDTVIAKEILKSYILKNCMFHVLEKHYKADFYAMNTKSYNDKELYKFVGQIFHTLPEFLIEENLPSFIFPWLNIFTFEGVKNRTVKESHVRCSYIKVFVKFILRLLGEPVDFTDIDIDCLSEYK